MVGKNNDYMHMQKTSKKVFRFSLRKLSVGTVSVVASSLFFGSGSVSASDVAVSPNAENVVVSENSQTEKQETQVIEQNTEAVVAPAVTKNDTVGISESVEKPVVVEAPEKELVIDKTQETPVVLDKAPAEGAGFRNTTPASQDVLLNNAKFLQPESDANTLVQVSQNLPAQWDVKKVTDVLPMIDDKIVGDVTLHDAAVNKILVKYADDTTQVIDVTYKQEQGKNVYTLQQSNVQYIPHQDEVKLNNVYTKVKAEVEKVSLHTDPVITTQLAPNRISITDVTNKKLEIMGRDKRTFEAVTNEEATAELKADYIKELNLEKSFERAKKALQETVYGLVQQSDAIAKRQSQTVPTEQQYVDKILKNKEKLLLGLSYIDRLYDLDFGDVNIKNILTYSPSFYAPDRFGEKNPIDFLVEIGSQKFEDLKLSSNLKTFAQLFTNRITDKTNVAEFLEYNNKLFNPTENIADWVVKESNAIIFEQPSTNAAQATVPYRLYDKLKAQKMEHLLPVLSVSEDSIYVLSNTATITYGTLDYFLNPQERGTAAYQAQKNNLLPQLKNGLLQQQRFIDFVYRIAKPHTHQHLQKMMLSLDSLLMNIPATDTSKRWSPKVGDKAALGVQEFITPLGLYFNYLNGAGGEAVGENIRFYNNNSITLDGLSTYAHELVHVFEDKVLMDQNLRDGLGVEFYPRGMFEPYYAGKVYGFNEPVFSLNSIYDVKESDFINENPERFESADDLKTYMKSLLDVVYTLEVLEAEDVLARNDSTKQKWFNKIESVVQPKTGAGAQGDEVVDKVSTITVAQAAALKNVSDLVERDMIVSRTQIKGLDTTGTYKDNDYVVVPLFSSNYAAVESANRESGEFMTRRLGFELLAEYGYYEGLVPYISNQYKNAAQAEGKTLSDVYILNKVSNGTFDSFKDFKKKMYETRAAKLNQLEPITIDFDGNRVEITTLEQLKQLVKSAIDKDLANTRPTTFAYETNLEKLKTAIFKAYKVATNDFRESIYTDKKPEFKVPDKAPDRPALPLGDIWINGLGETRPELTPGNIGVNGASETRPELTPGNIGVNGVGETRPELTPGNIGVNGASQTRPELTPGNFGTNGASETRPELAPGNIGVNGVGETRPELTPGNIGVNGASETRPELTPGNIGVNGASETRPELTLGNIGVNGTGETRPELTPGNIGINGASETRPSLESLFVGVKGSSITAPTLPLGAIGISGEGVTRPVLLPLLTLVENSLQDTVSQAESNAKVDVSLWKEIDSSKKLSSAIPYTAQKVLPKTGDAANTGSIGIMVLLTSIGLVSKRRKTEN